MKARKQTKGAPVPRPVIADENGFAPNLPYAKAVRFHRRIKAKVNKAKRPDATLLKIEDHALRAVALSAADDLKQAAQRALYMADYWMTGIQKGRPIDYVGSYPFVVGAIYDLRRHLPRRLPRY